MTEAQKDKEVRIQSSPQSQNGGFVNPNGVSTKLFSQETWEVTKEYIFGKRIDPKPLIDLPIHQFHPEQWNKVHTEQLIFLITYEPKPFFFEGVYWTLKMRQCAKVESKLSKRGKHETKESHEKFQS